MDREMQQRNWAIEGLVKGVRFPLCLSFSPNSNTYLSLLFRPITVPDGEPRKKSMCSPALLRSLTALRDTSGCLRMCSMARRATQAGMNIIFLSIHSHSCVMFHPFQLPIRLCLTVTDCQCFHFKRSHS